MLLIWGSYKGIEMGFLEWISGIFNPVRDLIREFHLSDGDRMRLENELAKIEADAQAKAIELEKERIKLQTAEVQSSYWLAANYRPIVYLVVTTIVLFQSFGLCHPAESFWTFAQVILGVGIAGRSYEKVTNIRTRK